MSHKYQKVQTPELAPQTTIQRLGSLDPESRQRAQGIGGDPLDEGVPGYIQTQTERVYSGGNNTSIVLGRDRPHNRLSGYGGIGYWRAGAIDLVAGRFGHDAKGETELGKDGQGKSEAGAPVQKLWVNPSFERDAARIHISQRTDVDRNFQITGGRIGTSDNRSAVTLKADGIRIIGRQGIKLVTRTDRLNSQGGEVSQIEGIDIIAGNDDSELEPLVRGCRLSDALTKIISHIDKLNGIVDSLLMAQMQFNEALTHHWHFSPFYGIPTTPSMPVVVAGGKTMIDHFSNTKRSLTSQKIGLQNFKTTYLSMSGAKYINSRYNNVN